LRRQSYNVFLPLERKTRRHARRFDTVLRPFFPGYLFLSLDSECDPWRPINGTFGVLRIVTSGDRPTPAPVGVVEALKNLCNADGMLARQANLELRQTVRVTEGPFADLVGKLHRLDTGARVCVLLDMMDGAVTAWLPRSNVTTAENSI
jgi:transcription antitermination factor NusG